MSCCVAVNRGVEHNPAKANAKVSIYYACLIPLMFVNVPLSYLPVLIHNNILLSTSYKLTFDFPRGITLMLLVLAFD